MVQALRRILAGIPLVACSPFLTPGAGVVYFYKL
jgi:hypothetical protein